MSLGFAPRDTLGTNKLQASFGSGSAAWHYARAAPWFCAIAASLRCLIPERAAGAWVVRQLDPECSGAPSRCCSVPSPLHARQPA